MDWEAGLETSRLKARSMMELYWVLAEQPPAGSPMSSSRWERAGLEEGQKFRQKRLVHDVIA